MGPESEDEDLLAPVHYAESSEEPDEDDPEFWSDDDGGVSDRERIIRVWVDEGRLTKVRVSSGWAAKLELRDGTRLQDVVNAVLRAAHVGVAAPSSLPQDAPTVELTKEFARSLPGLTPTSLEAMRAHYARRHREFAEKLREAMETAVAPVGASVEGVTVTLDQRGQAAAVDIDEAWLEEAHAGAISTAIMSAARDAYATFEAAPSPQRQAFHEVAREYDYLSKVMNAILVPKERR